MLQFDAASVVTSNPFCVNGKDFFSRNRESSAWTLAGRSNSAQRAALVNAWMIRNGPRGGLTLSACRCSKAEKRP